MGPRKLAVVSWWLQAAVLFAAGGGGQGKPESGREIFLSACAACHGADGKGTSRNSVGFDVELPDFGDCRFAMREADGDWSAVVHNGGPARAFSPIMPSFREALTSEQIDHVLNYLRGYCKEPAWPRGELNLPRPLVTEKAFPEDETVIASAINASGTPAATQKLIYEKRFGARNQIEIVAPFAFRDDAGWRGGVGDLAVGYKRVLFHSLRSGSIFSVTGETILPTGNRARGFGEGATIFEPFATFGQLLPADGFVQFQGGVELPASTRHVHRSAFWRAAVGKTFAQEEGFGRAWSPMVEFLAAREFAQGARVNWDLVPQVQVSLSKRQHVLANFGVRVPATNTAGRPVQVMFYLLWDWFDGPLQEGW
jgi:mono/diheme cytochrome c family protein